MLPKIAYFSPALANCTPSSTNCRPALTKCALPSTNCTQPLATCTLPWPNCEICLEKQPIFKKKSKLQIVGFALLYPIYLLGIFIFGVVAFFRFLAAGGLAGLIIVGWTISGIYHFFFVFIPYIFSFLL